MLTKDVKIRCDRQEVSQKNEKKKTDSSTLNILSKSLSKDQMNLQAIQQAGSLAGKSINKRKVFNELELGELKLAIIFPLYILKNSHFLI